jgi:hypothetical protein
MSYTTKKINVLRALINETTQHSVTSKYYHFCIKKIYIIVLKTIEKRKTEFSKGTLSRTMDLAST